MRNYESFVIRSFVPITIGIRNSLMRNFRPLLLLAFYFFAFHNFLSAQPYFDVVNFQFVNSPEKKFLNSKNNPSGINYFSAQAGLPFKLKKDLLLFNPFYEQYNLWLQTETNTTQTLNSIGLPVTFLKQWKNPAWKTAFVFIPRINADFKSTTQHGYQFGGAILAVYKKKENLKYKFGVYYNSEFFGPFFIPLLGIDWNINERLNLFGVLPGNLALEYKLNSSLYGGINFKSITNSYRFDGLSYLKISDNYMKIFLDYYVEKKFVVTLEAGHTILRKYKTGHTNEQFVQNNFSDGMLLKVGPSYRIRLNLKDQ